MKNFNLALMVVGLTTWLTACTGANNSSTQASSAASASTQLNQTPLISCTVYSTANNIKTTLMRVSNLTQASNFSVPPAAPATVSMDCSQSVAADGTPVKISLSQNGGAYVPLTNGQFQQIYGVSGMNTMSVSVTDNYGQSSMASFKLPVSCTPSAANAINLNLAGISFSQGSSGPGYLNVTIPSATGGRGLPGDGFMYALDVNGDQRFDDYHQQYWSTGTSYSNMYTLYNGTRTVSVTAFDTGCNLEKTFTTNVDFTKLLPAIQTGAMAQQTSYYYVQGQIDTLSNSTDPADTVHPYQSVELPLANPLHVICNYNSGQFDIVGINTYADGNVTTSEALLKQGVEIAWSINDSGAAGSITQNNVPINKLGYKTAASPDGNFNQWDYELASSCTTNVVITRASSVQPCNPGQTGAISPVTIIQGTYSCPKLTASASGISKSIQITNGYYYCQTAPTNTCTGGGGGGGGQPPVPF